MSRKYAPKSNAMVGRIIRKNELHLFTGLKSTAIDNGIMDGTFPKPIPIGKRAIGWREDEIIKWQERQTAKRDDPKLAKERLRRITPPGSRKVRGLVERKIFRGV